MPACEKCWADAFGRTQDHPMKSQTEHYQDLLEERKFNPCTPEQQKGERQSMNTGCPDCDKAQKQTGSKIKMCGKHYLEYLEWVANTAQKDLKVERERQSEHCTD